jgi:hypothetical protein
LIPLAIVGVLSVFSAYLLSALPTSAEQEAARLLATVAPEEAIAFEGPGFQREIGHWRLTTDQHSLQIPHLGSAGSGKLGALVLGRSLSAALFSGAFFSGEDRACHPDLGSDRHPRLLWRGATARFEPAMKDAWPPKGPHGVDQLEARSLIVFRRSAGPPPGILLLSRLKTLGFDCPRVHHRTYYQRLFLPLDDVNAEGRCLDLALLDPRPNPLRAERLVFLRPGLLTPELARLRAPYEVALFAEPACQGPSLVLASNERRADLHLKDFGFRGRLKSLRFQLQVRVQPPLAGFKPDPLPAVLPADLAAVSSGGLALTEVVERQALGPFLGDPAIRPAGVLRQGKGELRQSFAYPILGHNRLGFCLADGRTCGEVVAHGWCRYAGFSAALSWKEDPGSAVDFPTLSLDWERLCSSRDCSGFREIVCGG